jgi:carbon-monoxide dehydrogenase small subunit
MDGATGAPATLRVNGLVHSVAAPPHASLAEVLRDQLGLTGTKIGCATGDCGACTVLVDSRPVMACLILAGTVRSEVTTIEGLCGPTADALRTAFVTEGAFQCGYCTSGQVVACHGLVARAAELDDAALADLLSGNICRCTGYAGILRAVRAAAEAIAMAGEP